MNIIFLDIDGVLNCSTTSVYKFGMKGITGIEPAKAIMLTELVDDVGAKVVLSSTWRREEMWRTAMVENGLPKRIFIDRTPYISKGKRGDEIEWWIKNNPYVAQEEIRYVILDDDSDMLPHQLPFFVQTSWRYGLSQKHCDEVRRIFLS